MSAGLGEPILQLVNITKVFRPPPSLFSRQTEEVVALDRVSLTVQEGEIIGLVGESGSGKTTAGRLMVGLERAQGGRILLEGKDTAGLRGPELKRFRRKIQMIFQDPYQSLNPQVTVLHAVSEPLAIHGLGNGRARREKVAEVLGSVGLSPPEDFLHRYPHQLSGGQRQRVAIARAMVLDPAIMVADEPTSMLDASLSAHIYGILTDMRDIRGITIVFITHNLAAARHLCNRIGVVYRGRLVEIGPADHVVHTPRHPYTQALLDAIPRLGGRPEKRYGALLKRERTGRGSSGCPFYPRCRKADEDRCSKNAPRLAELEPGRSAACFYV